METVSVLEFSVRCDADVSEANPYVAVEQALGCKFEHAIVAGTPVLRAQMLGMSLIFARWRGPAGREGFQLHGVIDDVRYFEVFPRPNYELRVLDVSHAIIALLQVNGQHGWRIPRREEIDAEINYEREREHRTRNELEVDCEE